MRHVVLGVVTALIGLLLCACDSPVATSTSSDWALCQAMCQHDHRVMRRVSHTLGDCECEDGRLHGVDAGVP